eukprot:TRINITY_DN2473_c0_g1_i1.p1 TRINITY_DN2473_c0_g1~~TRINITY_DN2473_c0_g1_i1.p1  ORF type:complete len:583 (-),score=249.74 TRINITY_DN2473_c0_g1_i1:91-1818(-)
MKENEVEVQVEGEGGEKKLSKKQLKKLEQQKKKDEQKKQREEEEKKKKEQEMEKFKDFFGNSPLNRSQSKERKNYTKISNLSKKDVGQQVLIRGRVLASRGAGNLTFIVIRQRVHTLQAVVAKTDLIPKEMVLFAKRIPVESIVDFYGEIGSLDEVENVETIESCTQKEIELRVTKIFVSSEAQPLPIQILDCSVPRSIIKKQKQDILEISKQIEILKENKESTEEIKNQILELEDRKSKTMKYVSISRKVRLDNRVIDLRTLANQALFRLQSAVCLLFRNFLIEKDFTEIHSPKIISAASEGGANVFPVTYFEQKAYLAQSPQLYKQMAICGDFDRVFEIGPVFRAENSNTHRHLTEFVGLDIEMAFNDHYHEVLDVLGEMFVHIFDRLGGGFYKSELEAIDKQFGFQPLKYQNPTLRLEFPEGIKLLRENGVKIGDYDDLSTEQEKFLGKLVKEKYDTDFYFLDRFPTLIRPFYTMVSPDDPNYTNSYDFFLRSEEITSGAQRIHDSKLLEERALHHGIKIEQIQSYIDSFKYGAPPHAGCGIGLERMVMLYTGVGNIRNTSLFPRDPSRLNP